ncbi:MAG: transcription termination/antitermination protein NusG [Bacilli bacterium]
MAELKSEWYVVNTYSGHENKVKANLEMRSASMGMTDYIFRVIVPTRIETELKNGEETKKEKKSFPGYVLVEMIMTDESWYVVRNTPGVTGFIGSSGGGAKPIPLFPEEVEPILASMGIDESEEIVSDIEVGDTVQLIDGAFSGMNGRVDEIDTEKGLVVVSVDLFGQLTPVDIEYNNVKKVEEEIKELDRDKM